MLGSGDKVGVDCLDVLGVGLAAPADQHPLDDGVGLIDPGLRDHRPTDATGALRHEGHGHDRGTRELFARGVIANVEQRLEAPRRSEHGECRLDIDTDVTGVHGDREGLGRRQTWVELVVDEESPHVAVGHPTDEVLDVDAAVAQGAAFFVWLGNLGLEGDDTLESRHEVRHVVHSHARGTHERADLCCGLRRWARTRLVGTGAPTVGVRARWDTLGDATILANESPGWAPGPRSVREPLICARREVGSHSCQAPSRRVPSQRAGRAGACRASVRAEPVCIEPGFVELACVEPVWSGRVRAARRRQRCVGSGRARAAGGRGDDLPERVRG